MKALIDEIVKGNAYFSIENLHNVRTIFRFRMELFEAKLNFKQKPEYKSEGYMCESCEREIDENTHVLFCPSYKSLREGKDLYSDSDLSEYLRKVLFIRSELRFKQINRKISTIINKCKDKSRKQTCEKSGPSLNGLHNTQILLGVSMYLELKKSWDSQCEFFVLSINK